jgi:hypothetical protein
MKPRVSISDEALAQMGSALEDAASERMMGEVVREPWVCLHLEQTAKDAERDQFPIVCRDGMAPIVVACIRAAAKACDDTDEKRQLQRAAKAVQAAYEVSLVPSMSESIEALAERGMITLSRQDADDVAEPQASRGPGRVSWSAAEIQPRPHDPYARPPFAGFPRWLVVLAAGVGGTVLIMVLIAVLLAMAD